MAVHTRADANGHCHPPPSTHTAEPAPRDTPPRASQRLNTALDRLPNTLHELSVAQFVKNRGFLPGRGHCSGGLAGPDGIRKQRGRPAAGNGGDEHRG